MLLNSATLSAVISSPLEVKLVNPDNSWLNILVPAAISILQLIVFGYIYLRQAKIMDQQKVIAEQTTAMLKQSQQSSLLTEIYKNFFDNGIYKEIFMFLSNPSNKKTPLDSIIIQKSGGNYKPSGIVVIQTTIKPGSPESINYLWLEDCLDDYLGWFEILNHAIASNLVEVKIAERLFGHYLSESMDNQAIREYITPEPHLWQDLKGLCDLFEVKFPSD